MNHPPLVPPIKCQGIKTKLVKEIASISGELPSGRWIEPFCGSCVVALNVQPKRALLCDSNVHIIQVYQDIQRQLLTPSAIKEYLIEHGEKLRTRGETYYYDVRDRFNTHPNSFDFLFLNRACFNGVMRFNRSGRFNVPFCRKPDRFAPAYITKIVNQVQAIARVMTVSDWELRATDFRDALADAQETDIVYADPPYAGRHTDYFNSWSEKDESDLAECLLQLPCRFVLSTWHSNQFRANQEIVRTWASDQFHIFTRAHYYHVGPTEDLRHPMIEALITNFPYCQPPRRQESQQGTLFVEEQRNSYALPSIRNVAVEQ